MKGEVRAGVRIIDKAGFTFKYWKLSKKCEAMILMAPKNTASRSKPIDEGEYAQLDGLALA